MVAYTAAHGNGAAMAAKAKNADARAEPWRATLQAMLDIAYEALDYSSWLGIEYREA